MATGGLRVPVEVEVESFEPRPGAGRPFAIEARVVGEDAAAVPLDRVLWRGGEPQALMLRRGKDYIVRVVDPDGRAVHESRVDLPV